MHINDLPPELLLLILYHLYYSPRYKVCKLWKELLESKNPSPQEIVLAGSDYPRDFVTWRCDAVVNNEMWTLLHGDVNVVSFGKKGYITFKHRYYQGQRWRLKNNEVTLKLYGFEHAHGDVLHIVQRDDVVCIVCWNGVGLIKDGQPLCSKSIVSDDRLYDVQLTKTHIVYVYLYHYVVYDMNLAFVKEVETILALIVKTSATTIYTSADFSLPLHEINQLCVVDDDRIYAHVRKDEAGRIDKDKFVKWADNVSYIQTCPEFVLMVIDRGLKQIIELYTHARVLFFKQARDTILTRIMYFPGHGWHVSTACDRTIKIW